MHSLNKIGLLGLLLVVCPVHAKKDFDLAKALAQIVYDDSQCQKAFAELQAKAIHKVMATGTILVSTALVLGYMAKVDGAVLCRLLQAQDAEDAEANARIRHIAADSGIKDSQNLFIKISDAPLLQQGLMLATSKGIIIHGAIYRNYVSKTMNADVFEFLIRHECSHIRNHDGLKWSLLGLAGTVGIYLASDKLYDYCVHRGIVSPTIAEKIADVGSNTKSALRSAGAFLWSTLCVMRYKRSCEKRCDMDAATNKDLAQAGVKLFDALHAEELKVNAKGVEWLENHPGIANNLLPLTHPLNKTRTEYLQKKADEFEQTQVDEYIEHLQENVLGQPHVAVVA